MGILRSFQSKSLLMGKLAHGAGTTFGGHLAPGTLVFACECVIQVLEGPQLVRRWDEQTGLPLWDMGG